MVNVTLLGVHPGAPRLRSDARPGDAVAVTGSLGASAAGLYVLEVGPDRAHATGLAAGPLAEIVATHLRPRARVAEGRWLGEAGGVHAMIDCSDGLATDLEHICRESGVGARVRLDRVPVAAAALVAGRALGIDARDWAVGGGEDYELLLTCDPGAIERLAAGLAAATGTPLTVIGRIEGDAGRVVFVTPTHERRRCGAATKISTVSAPLDSGCPGSLTARRAADPAPARAPGRIPLGRTLVKELPRAGPDAVLLAVLAEPLSCS